MEISPCKDCINRVAGCHATCTLYGEWKKKSDQVRSNRNKARQTENAIMKYMKRL